MAAVFSGMKRKLSMKKQIQVEIAKAMSTRDLGPPDGETRAATMVREMDEGTRRLSDKARFANSKIMPSSMIEEEKEAGKFPDKRRRSSAAIVFVEKTAVSRKRNQRWMTKAKLFYNDFRIQVTVAILIVANFICNITEKQIWPSGKTDIQGGRIYAKRFGELEMFFTVAFTVELSINMYAHWFREFWRSGWNVFDFVTVATSWLFQLNIPLPRPLRLLRMVRALRVFRLFKRVKSLRRILEALARAVPGVVNAFLIMTITMCIYAILAVDFFRTKGKDGVMEFEWCHEGIRSDRRAEVVFDSETSSWVEIVNSDCPTFYTARGNEYGHEYFGNFCKALFSMFQILTGDSWAEAIARPLLDNWGPIGSGLFFVSFIQLHSVVLINVVVAVLLEKMVDEDADDENEEAEDDVGVLGPTSAEEASLSTLRLKKNAAKNISGRMDELAEGREDEEKEEGRRFDDEEDVSVHRHDRCDDDDSILDRSMHRRRVVAVVSAAAALDSQGSPGSQASSPALSSRALSPDGKDKQRMVSQKKVDFKAVVVASKLSETNHKLLEAEFGSLKQQIEALSRGREALFESQKKIRCFIDDLLQRQHQLDEQEEKSDNNNNNNNHDHQPEAPSSPR